VILYAIFTVKDVSLLLRGKDYDAFIWSYMLHRCEMWSLKRENELAMHRTEMRMIRLMCGVKLRDKLSCIEFRQ